MSQNAILPRIFISCVSDEFRSIRRQVEGAVRHLCYEPVTMGNWSLADGELFDWHRRHIGSCDGLIQIVGIAYGGEPEVHDRVAHGIPDGPERYSYTQFEFLYAARLGKKTWVIQPGDACTRDTPAALLDLPKNPATGKPDPDLPGAADLQVVRRRLQQDYLQLLRAGNHVRHSPADDKDLKILILTLRDHAAELRHNFGEWQGFVTGHLSRMEKKADRLLSRSLITLGILLALGLGGWACWLHLSRGNQTALLGIADIQAGQTLDTGRVRAHLISASENALHRDLAEADAVHGDFQKREKLRQAAESAHKQRLSRVEEHVHTFAELAAASGNSPVLDELLRVLDEQGIHTALAYLDTRRAEILQKVSNKIDDARRQLQPFLTAAQAALTAGRNDEAESLFRDLLHPAHPRWPDARHEFWTYLVFTKGPRAESHGTKAEARTIYEESERHARRLIDDEQENPKWRRNLSISQNMIGGVASAEGRLEEAARRYAESLAIMEKLASATPGNIEWQRDISVSLNSLGGVAVAQGRLDEAARRFSDSLALREKLAVVAAPSNTEWQRDVSVSHSNLGDVAVAQGRLEEAARRYADSLAVFEKLVAVDPHNTEWQRDLSICHGKLGDLGRAQGQLDVAARHYADSLGIMGKLIAGDPANMRWKRDISVIYERLGDIAVSRGELDEAARNFERRFESMEELTIADPDNTEWQRDLSVSRVKLGDFARDRGSLDEAVRNYVESLAIVEKLVAADPSNTTWQRDNFVSQYRLGEVASAQGRLDEASHRYTNGLKIMQNLADTDPGNMEWQRDLFVLYLDIARVASAKEDLAAAMAHLLTAHDILHRIEKGGFHVSPGDQKKLQSLRRQFGLDRNE